MKMLGSLLHPKHALFAMPRPRLSSPFVRNGSTRVALDIAGAGLRITAMRGREVNFWQHLQLPAGLLHKGWIADAEEFGAALREHLERSALIRGRVLFTLPGTFAVGRVLNLELGTVGDPNALIASEAARAMPVDPEDYYLYWHKLDDQPQLDGRAMSTVFALAVEKGALEIMLRACAVAGIRARGADLRPLALALAVGQTDTVLADVEATNIDISIIAQGIPVAMRSIFLGDEPLDPGFIHSKVVEELVTAIRLYEETNPDTPLGQEMPIYLTGSLSDAALAGRVAFVTKHPTVQPEAPFPCPGGFPTGRFMANLGLLRKAV